MTGERITISGSDLRAALDRILGSRDEEIELDCGAYWEVPLTEGFNVSAQRQPTIGHVADDVESVIELLARSDGEVFAWHDLSHLIGVLRAIAAADLP